MQSKIPTVILASYLFNLICYVSYTEFNVQGILCSFYARFIHISVCQIPYLYIVPCSYNVCIEPTVCCVQSVLTKAQYSRSNGTVTYWFSQMTGEKSEQVPGSLSCFRRHCRSDPFNRNAKLVPISENGVLNPQKAALAPNMYVVFRIF